MKAENIVFETKVNGYRYIYDKNGFINVFDNDSCFYRHKADCQSKKDFEIEVTYTAQKVYELNFN
jgi:hypothetical protein